MNNELIVAPVTDEQAQAWYGLAQGKNQMMAELQKKELESQKLLILPKDATYQEIDPALADYRKAFTEMVEFRKPFTNLINTGIIEPLMAFEKRVDPKVNQTYIELTSRSLELRKTEADEVAKINAKNQEISNFKTHVINGFHQTTAEWRQTIRKEIAGFYKRCLTDRVSEAGLGLDGIKELLFSFEPPKMAPFVPRFLTKEEMLVIYTDDAQIPKPDYNSYFSDLMEEMDVLFANYSSDLANAEAAIKHQQEQAKLQEIEDAKTLQEEQALNTLIATSETVTIEEPKIKRTVQVTVIESWAWGNAVMAAFMLNQQKLGGIIRVKKVSSLSIGQMADYLGKYATDEGVTFNGLVLKEIEK